MHHLVGVYGARVETGGVARVLSALAIGGKTRCHGYDGDMKTTTVDVARMDAVNDKLDILKDLLL